MELYQIYLVWYRRYAWYTTRYQTAVAHTILAFAVVCTALVVAFCVTLVSPFHTTPASALTSVPTKMNFQGRLTDATGNIKPNGVYNMKLKLYSAASGGTLVWSEDRLVSAGQGVSVANGLFAFQVGDVAALSAANFASDLYFEVELPTPASATSSSPVWSEGPMTPRSQLASHAYAFNSDTLDGLDSSTFTQTAANNTFTGLNTFRPTTNSQNAFTIQNSTSQNIVQVDTTNAGTVTLLGNNSGEPGPWQTSANALPGVRSNPSSVVANGYAYVVGGYDGSSTYSTVYYAKLGANGDISSWQTATNSLPATRAYHTSIVANGYLYVIGGWDNIASAQSTVFYAKLNTDGSVGVWRSANNLPAAIQQHTSVVSNGYVYVMGGRDGNAGAGHYSSVYYARLNADGSLGAWYTTSNMPATRRMASSVIANGYVYVIGGNEAGTTQSTVFYAKLSPDGTLGAWQTASSLPAVRWTQSSVVANGYVYVFGGVETFTYQASVYYAKLNADGTVGAWQTATNTLPAARGWQANSIIANGYAYIMGGANSSGTTQSTVFYSRLGGVVSVGGSLDLVGSQGQTLADGGDSSTGSTGGSITAGNITAVGSLQVQGQSLFNDSVSVNRDFTVGNNLLTVDDNNAGTVTLLGNNSGEVGEWKTSANGLPTARAYHSSVTANGYMYLIGGGNETLGTVNTVSYAKLNSDGSTGPWQTSANILPLVRSHHSSVAANGHLYVIGGNDGVTHATTIYYAKLNADGSVGTWQTATNSFPAARSYHSSVTANGYIYVIGGATTNTTFHSTVFYAKLNADGSVGTWQTATNSLPDARGYHSSVVANGYVYVLGGYNNAAYSTVFYAKLNADGSVGTWQTATNSLLAARMQATSVVVNGYLYVLSGYDTSMPQSTALYAKLNADGSVGTWQAAKNSLPTYRLRASAVTANGFVYVIGGWYGTTQPTVLYSRLGGVVNVGGSLDLVGLQGQNLADGGDHSTGSTGGSVTAGNVTAVGSMQVQKQALFSDSASILGDFNASNGLFSASSSGTVRVGSATPDGVGAVLVLDSSSGSDPVAGDGAMYYQTATGKFRCRESGAWKDCVQPGYSISVMALSHNPADATTYYMGTVPRTPTTTAGQSKVYIRKAGTIKAATLMASAGTAGTNESWTMNIYKNGTSVLSLSPVAAATAEWNWVATGQSIAVAPGDYLEIGVTTPTWATNPANMSYTGSLVIE